MHNLYVVDYASHQILKWEKDSITGSVVAGDYGQGNAPNQRNPPEDIVVDKSGTMFITHELVLKVGRKVPHQE